jgi:hypothetical protein
MTCSSTIHNAAIDCTTDASMYTYASVAAEKEQNGVVFDVYYLRASKTSQSEQERR